MALYIPTSVLGKVSAICLESEKHIISDLHEIVDLLGRYRFMFLHPRQSVAEACYNLYSDDWRDSRMSPSDLVHF